MLNFGVCFFKVFIGLCYLEFILEGNNKDVKCGYWLENNLKYGVIWCEKLV